MAGCKSYAESVCFPKKTPDCTDWVEKATRKTGLGHQTPFIGTQNTSSELSYAEIGCIFGGTTIVLLLGCIGIYACKKKEEKDESSDQESNKKKRKKKYEIEVTKDEESVQKAIPVVDSALKELVM